MALVVFAAPVPPEKVAQHRQLLAELQGPRRAQFEALHRQARVREQGFIQPLPAGGYLYLTVFAGDDPASLVQRLLAADQADADFAQWFFPQLAAIHGLDLSQGVPPMPEQVLDSGPVDGVP
jgi:hypothetical protein